MIEAVSVLMLAGLFADGWRTLWPIDWRGWMRVIAFGTLVGFFGASLRPYL